MTKHINSGRHSSKYLYNLIDTFVCLNFCNLALKSNKIILFLIKKAVF